MPRLNLRDHDDDFKAEPPDQPGQEPNPQPGEYDDGQGRRAPWIVLAVVAVLIGVVVVALNHFHVIQLWGKKVPHVVEALPETSPVTQESASPGAQPGVSEAAPPQAEPTPLPTEPAKPKGKTKAGKRAAAASSAASAGEGGGTGEAAGRGSLSAEGPAAGAVAVQVSSWPSRGTAGRIASRLTSAGFHAYVEKAEVNGKTWYRVRVGNYASNAEADAAVRDLQQKGFEGAIVVK
jgi:cell division protein FtsN